MAGAAGAASVPEEPGGGIDEGAARSRGRRDGRPAAEALMDAALVLLRERGVLAGVNLQEVAKAAGVTPANIYNHFGGRQGLLRAAIARRVAPLAGTLELESAEAYDLWLELFDAIARNDGVPLTALLAIDGDPDFVPLPYLERSRARYEADVAAGLLPPVPDFEAVHIVVLLVSAGHALYAEGLSRQLGISPEELQARLRAVVLQLLRSFPPQAADH